MYNDITSYWLCLLMELPVCWNILLNIMVCITGVVFSDPWLNMLVHKWTGSCSLHRVPWPEANVVQGPWRGNVWEVCILLELAKHGGKTLNLKVVFIRTGQTHLGDKWMFSFVWRTKSRSIVIKRVRVIAKAFSWMNWNISVVSWVQSRRQAEETTTDPS